MKLRQNKLVPLVLEDRPGIGPVASWSGARGTDFERHIDRLEKIRQDWVGQVSGDDLPNVCLRLPQRLLEEYSKQRTQSRLGEVFLQANRYQSHTDRVIFLGSNHAHRTIKWFMDACCDPHWNELHRGERGSKPRVYFLGHSTDNDKSQGLLQLFSPLRPSNREEAMGWGVIALESSDESLAQRFTQDHIQQYLKSSGFESFFYQCPTLSPLGLHPQSNIPSSFLAFSEIGMLPAAVLGINIMELLSGAAYASRLFVSTSAHQNPILRWVAWKLSTPTLNMALWNQSLIAGCHWLSQLGNPQGEAEATPSVQWNCVTPLSHRFADRTLESCNHLWVENPRFDPLPLCPVQVDTMVWDPSSDRPRLLSPCSPGGPTIVDSTRDLFEHTLERQSAQGGLGLTIRFHDLGELSLGQWMQWMIIASILEAWVLDT